MNIGFILNFFVITSVCEFWSQHEQDWLNNSVRCGMKFPWKLVHNFPNLKTSLINTDASVQKISLSKLNKWSKSAWWPNQMCFHHLSKQREEHTMTPTQPSHEEGSEDHNRVWQAHEVGEADGGMTWMTRQQTCERSSNGKRNAQTAKHSQLWSVDSKPGSRCRNMKNVIRLSFWFRSHHC